MAPSFWQILIIAVIVLILFGGRGKISALMGDFGKGLRSFKDQMKSKEDDDETESITNKSSNKNKTKKKPKKKSSKNKV